MGDDKTVYYIKGHGVMDYTSQGKRIIQHGYYIPELGDIVLVSVKQHRKYTGCYFHSGNKNTTLAYPTLLLQQCHIQPEIQFNIHPTGPKSTQPVDYNYANAELYKHNEPTSSSSTNVDPVRSSSIHLILSTQLPYLPTLESRQKNQQTQLLNVVGPIHLTVSTLGWVNP